MWEYFNIIIYWIVFITILISTTNNYISFLRYYVLQVFLILVLFYMIYSVHFVNDIVLLASFTFAIIVRLIFIPWYINYFIKNFYVKKLKMRVTDRVLRIPTSLVFIILIGFFSLSYYASIYIFWKNEPIFVTSFFIFLSGMLNFVNHRKLVWDILSFLEIENAIFLIWLLILEKVPFYIEFWIMIDVLLILLILLILVYNIKQVAWSTNISNMSELKD
jgi:hydrogenase-4 membrane subunit HyfE